MNSFAFMLLGQLLQSDSSVGIHDFPLQNTYSSAYWREIHGKLAKKIDVMIMA